MAKRRTTNEWIGLIEGYKERESGLSLIAWCKKTGISKSSIYPHIKSYNLKNSPKEQKWGLIEIPKDDIKTPTISLRVGAITLDINSGFDKKMLTAVLEVVTNVC